MLLLENMHEYAFIGFLVLDPVAAIDPPIWTSVEVRYEFTYSISIIKTTLNILNDDFCLSVIFLSASIYRSVLIIVAFGDKNLICAQVKENEAKNNTYVV